MASADVIHAHYRHDLLWHGDARQRLRTARALLRWWRDAIRKASRYARINGPAVERATGKSCRRQEIEEIWLALRFRLPPRLYYVHELFDDARRRLAGEYLTRSETKGGGLTDKGVFALLRAGGQHGLLRDKLAFAIRCAEHGLPAVPVLAVARDGRIEWRVEPQLALGRDLFLKPRKARGGRGAERWDHVGGDAYRGGDGSVLSEAALLDRLRDLGSRVPYLLQPRLANHPAIADLSTGALSTVRAITCRDERGTFELTNALFRMAVGGNRVVDNFHAGGIAARIALDTGELGQASDMGAHPGRGWCDRHPDTGALIRGRRLPYWPETVELVTRAHSAFAGFTLIGWDVGLTDAVPCLVEGNGSPCVDLLQRSHRQPVGNARLGRLLAYHLEHRGG